MELDKKVRDAVIDILKNPSDEVPTLEEVRMAVGKGTDATTACWRLRLMGFSKRSSQLALQRAMSAGSIDLNADLSLTPA